MPVSMTIQQDLDAISQAAGMVETDIAALSADQAAAKPLNDKVAADQVLLASDQANLAAAWEKLMADLTAEENPGQAIATVKGHLATMRKKPARK